MGVWSNGLCGCFNNCSLCLVTYIAPCYTAGKNAQAVGNNMAATLVSYLLIAPVGMFLAAKARQKIREQKGIDVRLTIKSLPFLLLLLFVLAHLSFR